MGILEVYCFGWDQELLNHASVLLGYYVLDKGYDEKAEWSFETFGGSLGKSLGVRNVKESLPE